MTDVKVNTHGDLGGNKFKEIAKAILDKLASNPESEEYVFPSCISNTDRAYVHKLAQSQYRDVLATRSSGKGVNRRLHVWLKKSTVQHGMIASNTYFDVKISPTSLQHMQLLLARSPLTSKEKAECSTALDKFVTAEPPGDYSRSSSGQLSTGLAQIPPSLPSQLTKERQQGLQLPIQGFRQQILDMIYKNKVIIISGEPGCGKTTQVPQMILENCFEKGKSCRIVCTQPRRVSAVSVAVRVSAERGDSIGNSVGYQIRLESRVSPKTVLTFCTTGVFLRTLMSGTDTVGKTVTHLIIDEVHERDRYCDFLLISIREMLNRFPDLRVILMSATIQSELFSCYFGNCPVISVPGKCFEVSEYYLEDILEKTNHLKQLRSNNTRNQQLMAMLYGFSENMDRNDQTIVQHLQQSVLSSEETTEVDGLLYSAFTNTVDEVSLKALIEMIVDSRIDVNYRHTETGITTLMVAAQRGQLDVVKNLVNEIGADFTISANYGWTALDVAKHFGQVAVAHFLGSKIKQTTSPNTQNVGRTTEHSKVLEYQNLFDGYNPVKPKAVDHNLIFTVIKLIHQTAAIHGAILVFLPGYEDIVLLRDKLSSDVELMRAMPKALLLTLHSQMQSSEQVRVFRRSPINTRKIILATNIAETGITVDDVVFVIDTGLAKQKSYDESLGSHALELHWISRASAAQRRGRAGRCQSGVCYRLYSRRQLAMMQKYDEPEILRTPLHELCLQVFYFFIF